MCSTVSLQHTIHWAGPRTVLGVVVEDGSPTATTNITTASNYSIITEDLRHGLSNVNIFPDYSETSGVEFLFLNILPEIDFDNPNVEYKKK